MIVTKDQTLMIPATLEGYEYAEKVEKWLKVNNYGCKRKDTTTGITIKWSYNYELRIGDADG